MFYLRLASGVAVFMFGILAGALLALLGASRARVMAVVARAMGRVCPIVNLRVQFSGLEHLPTSGGCVVLGNQQSLLCYCIYSQIFMRHENPAMVARLVGHWDVPIMTWLFRKTGHFMVDHAHPMRTAAGMVRALRALREQGCQVWIGPEGTRSKPAGRLGTFQRGAFRLAIEAQVPIIPIVIPPLAPRSDLRARRLEPNTVQVVILPPIHTKGLTLSDATSLREHAYQQMSAAYGGAPVRS